LIDDLVSNDYKATILKKGRRFFSKHNLNWQVKLARP